MSCEVSKVETFPLIKVFSGHQEQLFLDKIHLKYHKVYDFWMCIDFWATHKALTYLKIWVNLSNLSSTFPSSLFLFPSAFCSSNPNACDGTCKLGSSLVSVISRGSGGSQWSLSLATILGHSTQPLWVAPCHVPVNVCWHSYQKLSVAERLFQASYY